MEQCTARYGAVVGKLKQETEFKKNGLMVFVTFHEGKVASIRYSGKVSPVMVQELLKANAGTVKWTTELDQRAVKIWTTEDKTYRAIFAPATPESNDDLVISYKPALDSKKVADEAADKKRVEGF